MNTVANCPRCSFYPYNNVLVYLLEEPKFCPEKIISFLIFKDRESLITTSLYFNKKIVTLSNAELNLHRKKWSAFFAIKLEKVKRHSTMQKICSKYDDFYGEIFEKKLKDLSKEDFLELKRQFEATQKWQNWIGTMSDPFDIKNAYDYLKSPGTTVTGKYIRALLFSVKDGFYKTCLDEEMGLIHELALKKRFRKIEELLRVVEEKNRHSVLKTVYFYLKKMEPEIANEMTKRFPHINFKIAFCYNTADS